MRVFSWVLSLCHKQKHSYLSDKIYVHLVLSKMMDLFLGLFQISMPVLVLEGFSLESQTLGKFPS